MRFGQTHIVIGGQGTGKSTYLVQNVLPKYYKAHRKILILATMQQPVYLDAGVEPLDIEYLENWCLDTKALGPRICSSNIDNYVEAIKIIGKHFNQYNANGGCIVFEDITTMAMLRNNNILKYVGEFVVNAKQINTDIWFVAHGLDNLPVRLIQLAHKIVMFRFLGFLNASAKAQCNPILLKALQRGYDTAFKFVKNPKKRIQQHLYIDVAELSNSI